MITFYGNGVECRGMNEWMMLMHTLKIGTKVPIQRILFGQLKFAETNVHITFRYVRLQNTSIEILQTS